MKVGAKSRPILATLGLALALIATLLTIFGGVWEPSEPSKPSKPSKLPVKRRSAAAERVAAAFQAQTQSAQAQQLARVLAPKLLRIKQGLQAQPQAGPDLSELRAFSMTGYGVLGPVVFNADLQTDGQDPRDYFKKQSQGPREEYIVDTEAGLRLFLWWCPRGSQGALSHKPGFFVICELRRQKMAQDKSLSRFLGFALEQGPR